tara:strand:- start:149 stop:343 length:195 start_codon:yes stop_codon:yes gene_type:complete
MKNEMYVKQIMQALEKAIETETPKLKEGQKLKSEISIVDGGIKVHVYPVPDITLTDLEDDGGNE